jgi:hypothetical protein
VLPEYKTGGDIALQAIIRRDIDVFWKGKKIPRLMRSPAGLYTTPAASRKHGKSAARIRDWI